MNKLVCSFKSNLPNEIDFAMQVATILANSDNFIWSKDYPLVDAICSSLHVFTCICDHDGLLSTSCNCYPRFWHKILAEKYKSNQYIQAATIPPDTEQSYLNFTNLTHHDLKQQQKIYKRVKTAAELIKQFSMTCGITPPPPSQLTLSSSLSLSSAATGLLPSSSSNLLLYDNNQDNGEISRFNNINYNYNQMKKKKLKASPALLKFVSLLLHCNDTPLNLIGLDILSNIASKLAKIPDSSCTIATDSTCTKLVQMFQEYCFDNISCQDGDIYIIIRSIEVVSKLISSSNGRTSTSVVNLINRRGLLSRIEQLLTSRNDVNLFLAALECCYRISRHQPHLIASGNAQHMIKILVNLLNCEDKQFFTTNALKRIKLIDNDSSDDSSVSLPIVESKIITPVTNSNNIPTNNSSANINNISSNNINSNSNNVNINMNSITNNCNNKPNTPSLPNNTNHNNQKNHTPIIKENGVGSNNCIPPTPPPTIATQPQAQLQVNQQQQQNQQLPPPPTALHPTIEYSCEWNNCNSKFPEAKQVYTHVFEVHIGSIGPDTLSSCLWSSPTGSGPGCLTKRPKYSLLTHLNDFHCNPSALERSRTRSDPIQPPEHPGYGPHSAIAAIKRHANSELNGSRASNNSPISVSVRLTAALILRNLATESLEMKQVLEYHEPLLSEICMTNGRDESKIIAECLSLFSHSE